MLGIGFGEWMIILLIVVLVFGVGKLPEVGKQLGQGIKNFKSELNAATQDPKQLPPDARQATEPRDVTAESKQG
jgi:sec-independent protein translocase protein TatA